MIKSDIWYGFLQAGAHSSPVVRDMTLETNNRKTLYLYNHARGRFLEYAREIVEAKLRELETGDIALKELDRAFKAARKSFSSGRTARKWTEEVTPTSTPEPDEPGLPSDLDTTIDFVEEDA